MNCLLSEDLCLGYRFSDSTSRFALRLLACTIELSIVIALGLIPYSANDGSSPFARGGWPRDGSMPIELLL